MSAPQRSNQIVDAFALAAARIALRHSGEPTVTVASDGSILSVHLRLDAVTSITESASLLAALSAEVNQVSDLAGDTN